MTFTTDFKTASFEQVRPDGTDGIDGPFNLGTPKSVAILLGLTSYLPNFKSASYTNLVCEFVC